MAIKFEKIAPGMTLLDIHSYRMGNTAMRKLGLWRVEIVSVDSQTCSAMVRWNGNPPQRWTKRQLEKLYSKPTRKYLAQQASRSVIR